MNYELYKFLTAKIQPFRCTTKFPLSIRGDFQHDKGRFLQEADCQCFSMCQIWPLQGCFFSGHSLLSSVEGFTVLVARLRWSFCYEGQFC